MNDIAAGLPPPGALQKIDPKNVALVPRGLVRGAVADALVQAGHALPMLDDRGAFTAVEVVVWADDLEDGIADGSIRRYAATVIAFEPWRHIVPGGHKQHLETLVQAFAAPRLPFAGLVLSAPLTMGIVNVTPDSFSDGGDFATADAAINHAIALREAGADILDVGGESTRPGAAPVSPEAEQVRVIPVVKELSARGLTVSIDTRHAATMAAALDAGASIVNDVTALTGDLKSLETVAQRKVPVVLMHMQGEPQTMQSQPAYQWAPIDIYRSLELRIEACVAAGLQRDQICIDPGIGFGKTDAHNLDLLDSLSVFHGLGCPMLIGASRKSFIGRLSGENDPKNRLAGSLSAALHGATQGVQILRVHDVAETRQALLIAEAQTA